uniref:CCHC-type domain-containing protein n=1 Tax=Lygus hesperus TaxID=30085 RepID=A0A146M5A2_LYGHE
MSDHGDNDGGDLPDQPDQPEQHAGNDDTLRVIDKTLRQMKRLFRNYNAMSQDTTLGIPRTLFMEIDTWNPDDVGALSVTSFFSNFDSVTAELTSDQRVRLLRAKTRGTAKQFLIDHSEMADEHDPYDYIKQEMLTWFRKENPQHAAERLYSVKRHAGESLRQFADRVRALAQSAVLDEGKDMEPEDRLKWVNKKTLSAFIKGAGKELSSLLTTNRPDTIREALTRAEELEDVVRREEDTEVKWDLAAVSGDRRCYKCGGTDHFAARCPQKDTPEPRRDRHTPRDRPHEVQDDTQPRTPSRPNPRYPCTFCASKMHFPVDCPHSPQKAIFCDFCGMREHLEADCFRKKKLMPVSNPPARRLEAETSTSMEIARCTPPPEKESNIPAIESPMVRTLRIRVLLGTEYRDMIIDTGAALSVLSRPIKDIPMLPTHVVAWGADGSPLPFQGQQHVSAQIGNTRFEHQFLVFARPGATLDLLGLDVLKKVPLMLHTGPSMSCRTMEAVRPPQSTTTASGTETWGQEMPTALEARAPMESTGHENDRWACSSGIQLPHPFSPQHECWRNTLIPPTGTHCNKANTVRSITPYWLNETSGIPDTNPDASKTPPHDLTSWGKDHGTRTQSTPTCTKKARARALDTAETYLAILDMQRGVPSEPPRTLATLETRSRTQSGGPPQSSTNPRTHCTPPPNMMGRQPKVDTTPGTHCTPPLSMTGRRTEVGTPPVTHCIPSQNMMGSHPEVGTTPDTRCTSPKYMMGTHSEVGTHRTPHQAMGTHARDLVQQHQEVNTPQWTMHATPPTTVQQHQRVDSPPNASSWAPPITIQQSQTANTPQDTSSLEKERRQSEVSTQTISSNPLDWNTHDQDVPVWAQASGEEGEEVLENLCGAIMEDTSRGNMTELDMRRGQERTPEVQERKGIHTNDGEEFQTPRKRLVSLSVETDDSARHAVRRKAETQLRDLMVGGILERLSPEEFQRMLSCWKASDGRTLGQRWKWCLRGLEERARRNGRVASRLSTRSPARGVRRGQARQVTTADPISQEPDPEPDPPPQPVTPATEQPPPTNMESSGDRTDVGNSSVEFTPDTGTSLTPFPPITPVPPEKSSSYSLRPRPSGVNYKKLNDGK